MRKISVVQGQSRNDRFPHDITRRGKLDPFGTTTRTLRRVLLAGVSAGSVVLAPSVAAQEVPPEDIAMPAPDAPIETGTGNDIIVTATKREMTLQDVPLAVSVATAEAIERTQVRDVRDLQTLIPSLRVSQAQALYATTYSVRGFGTSGNNAGLEPSVGVFVDGVYRSRAISQVSDLPDLQRVEVLRGPQSILFGKNASAGVISIVTREPEYDLGGNIEASYGNYNALVLKGYLTGAVSESAAASLSAGYNKRDGYIDDLGFGGKSNDRNRWFVRGQLKFEPNSQMRVRLIADYDRINEICCSVVNLRAAVPGATQAIFAIGGKVNPASEPFEDVAYTNRPSRNSLQNYGLSGQVDYDIGPLRMTSITALRKSHSDMDHDPDFSSADLIGRHDNHLDVTTFTQELRVATNIDGPFNLLLGGYYFHENAKAAQEIAYGTQFRAYADIMSQGAIALLEQSLGKPVGTYQRPGQGIAQEFDVRNKAWSLFGTVDVAMTKRMTLTVGANYTRDAKDVASNSSSTDPFSALQLTGPFAPLAVFQFLPPFLDIPNGVESGKTRDGDWSFNLRLAYNLSDTLRAYAAYSTGFKASSFNLSMDSRPSAADLAALRSAGFTGPLKSGSRFATPEDSKLFEFGIKGNWGIASANVTVFKQAIKNFQTNVFVGSGFYLANAEKQSTFGIEFDGLVKPVPELALSMAITYLDPRYDRYTRSAFGDQSGQRIVTVPQLSATWGAQWDQPLPNEDHLVARIDFHYESEVQPVPGLVGFIGRLADGTPDYAPAITAPRPFAHPVNDLGASLTYALRQGVELSVWGRNLLNERFITDMFDSVAQPGSISGYPNRPRTFGVGARYRF